MHDVIVVGAGLAGLACARDLARAGRRVLVLDKSRGVGGRAATRRLEEGVRLDGAAQQSVRLDHGAQYFTARGERLQQLSGGWQREGWLRVWTRGFPVWEDGRVNERPEGHPRFAPVNGMSALGRHFARALEVVTETLASSLSRLPDGWRVHAPDGRTFQGRALVLNLPAPQLAPLVRELPLGDAGVDLERVRFDPTWTLMLELARDLDVPWKGLEVRHPVLSWLSRDHTKREAGAPPVLVAHASGEWSRAHLEDAREDVQRALLGAVKEVVGEVDVTRALVHRWRFATPSVLYPTSHHWDAGLQLGWCGDWCGAAKVEGALDSGWSLARDVTASLGVTSG